MNNTHNKIINSIKFTDCKNIIEFINKATWMFCETGYGTVEEDALKKICLYPGYCENIDCRICENFIFEASDYLYSFNCMYLLSSLNKIPRDCYYILTVGIEL